VSAGDLPASRLRPNGVDGETGDYLFPETASDEALLLARGRLFPPDHEADLRERAHLGRQAHLGLIGGDPTDLRVAGWGVVFPEGGDAKVKAALEPLLRHRCQQAGSERYKELVYREGESKPDFLGRYRAGPGPVDPTRLPYYLLLAGSPTEIPFELQFHLDAQYAVGRVHFDDLDDTDRYDCYHRYAIKVVAAETSRLRRLPRRMTIFAPCTNGDVATDLMHRHLVEPLETALGVARRNQYAIPWNETKAQLEARLRTWRICTVAGAKASKETLLGLMGGENAPALLFTACHGIGYVPPDPRQRSGQGALLCAEWQGPGAGITPDCYVAARDLQDLSPGGLITFHFACYSAGTPATNHFVHRGPDERRILAPDPFVAALPQRLLAHPTGGALAVVGHIDRAWGFSFYSLLAGAQVQAFAATFVNLLGGSPIGCAMEAFNQRYSDLAVDVLSHLQGPGDVERARAVALWTALLDARNFVVLGDPAVRLHVEPS
jgi:hypothetical protein